MKFSAEILNAYSEDSSGGFVATISPVFLTDVIEYEIILAGQCCFQDYSPLSLTLTSTALPAPSVFREQVQLPTLPVVTGAYTTPTPNYGCTPLLFNDIPLRKQINANTRVSSFIDWTAYVTANPTSLNIASFPTANNPGFNVVVADNTNPSYSTQIKDTYNDGTVDFILTNEYKIEINYKTAQCPDLQSVTPQITSHTVFVEDPCNYSNIGADKYTSISN